MKEHELMLTRKRNYIFLQDTKFYHIDMESFGKLLFSNPLELQKSYMYLSINYEIEEFVYAPMILALTVEEIKKIEKIARISNTVMSMEEKINKVEEEISKNSFIKVFKDLECILNICSKNIEKQETSMKKIKKISL